MITGILAPRVTLYAVAGLGVVASVAFAYVGGRYHGSESTRKKLEARYETERLQAITRQLTAEVALGGQLFDIAQALNTQTQAIADISPQLVERVTHEIRTDIRYSDPKCFITDGVYDALNKARALTNDPPVVRMDRDFVPDVDPTKG